jgi:hypothetical protein
MQNERRMPRHQRSQKIEAEQEYLRGLLEPIEQQAIAGGSDLKKTKLPVVFIMGCPRSGTTLLLQYLASSRAFAYPTNFLSRFYYAPYVGARIQRMLYEYDTTGEICPTTDRSAESFDSNLGKTQGPLAPHEFWYFWRQYLQFGETQYLTSENLAASDGASFAAELRALHSLYDQPFVMKGMLLNWNIPFLASLFPESRFLFIQRDSYQNANSLLRARRTFFGDTKRWYSMKPPGVEQIVGEPPEVQVAWQVMDTNAAIAAGLDQLESDRFLRIQYEDFCSMPEDTLQAINDCWHPLEYNLENLPARFSASGPDDAELRMWDAHFDRAATLPTQFGNRGDAV